MLDQLAMPAFLRRIETPRQRAWRTAAAAPDERRIKNPPSNEVLALRRALRTARSHLLAGRTDKALAALEAALPARWR
jgi:hypothetical protein